MQLRPLVLGLACIGATVAQAGNNDRPDLRSSVREAAGETRPAPRQLSPQELAELRRQLSQYPRSGGKGP